MDPKSKSISRRDFLAATGKLSIAAMAGAGIIGCETTQPCYAPKSKVLGANERMNVAMIGVGGRGNHLSKSFAKIPNVKIKTIVDIDENLYVDRIKTIEEIQGCAPATEHDLRNIMDDKDIDAVVIATPNHWHALATIWACQAGKHVFVEKPCSHNIFEGRQMIKAARKYNRIVQVGFHNRSIGNVRSAMKALHDGVIGDVYMARGLCFKPRGSIGRYPDSKAPKGVHYDIWLGPAPERAFNRNRFHYNWHWHWAYGNGDIGNQGPHQFDIARWGMNKNEHPEKIRSFGGYYAYDCAQETANTQTATYEYADGKLLQFEVRGLFTNGESVLPSNAKTNKQWDTKIGNIFLGTKGWMAIDGGNWKTYLGKNNEPGPSSETVVKELDAMNLAGGGDMEHFVNFTNAVRSGKKEDLTCDIQQGHLSTALPHMANISYRLGRELRFDGKKEKFIGDSKANQMLTRKYRKPFIVPKNV